MNAALNECSVKKEMLYDFNAVYQMRIQYFPVATATYSSPGALWS